MQIDMHINKEYINEVCIDNGYILTTMSGKG
jgi:hypothetical protein